MALTIQGSNASNSSSVTIPTHAVGDIIVIFAYRDGTTVLPSKPTASGTVPAWVDIDAASGADVNCSRTAYFVATATNHTSGTWLGATGTVAVVLRGQKASSPIGGHAESGSTGTNTTSAPAITLSDASGTSVVLEFYGHRSVTAWAAPPPGYTRQVSTNSEVCFNTKNDTTSAGAIAQPCTASSGGYRGATVEILVAPETAGTFRYFFEGYGTYTFAPFNVENTSKMNDRVPSAAVGCYVTLLGGGGGGTNVYGAGGGARVDAWVPAASLGSTYSIVVGAGGAGGVAVGTAAVGGASSFVSGDVSLFADGGYPGDSTASPGGIATASGRVAAATANGSAGSTTGTGGSNSDHAGAGGGAYNAAGGSSDTAGGGRGQSGVNGSAGQGGGGGGGYNHSNGDLPGHGGLYGGGGGGGFNTAGGNGAAGYALVQWVDTAPNWVLYDATGAGNAVQSSSLSWSHTVGAAGNYVVTSVQVLSSISGAGCTATLAGSAMTQLGVYQNYSSVLGFYASHYMFGAVASSAGAQTVAASVSGGGTIYVSGNSTSYSNVGSTGTASTATGTSAAPLHTVSSATGQVVVQTFGDVYNSTHSFSAYSKNQRYNIPYVVNVNLAHLIGDTLGASSVNFSATLPSSQTWGSLAVPLLPP